MQGWPTGHIQGCELRLTYVTGIASAGRSRLIRHKPINPQKLTTA
jgi:hypothetical protein